MRKNNILKTVVIPAVNQSNKKNVREAGQKITHNISIEIYRILIK